MFPSFRFVLLCVALMVAWCCPAQAARSELIAETAVAQHGLTRPWFTQVELDPGRGRLRDLVLYEGTLYAQTDRATVQAIDAETGKTLWSAQVGQPNYPSLTPGANRDLLAVVNGSRLYVLNRFNGDFLFQKDVGGSPDAGAALSGKRAYVPLSNGMIVVYRLDPKVDHAKEAQKDEKDRTPEEKSQLEADRRKNLHLSQEASVPLFFQSYGQALVQPLVTRENREEEYVVWPTDRGYLNIGYLDRRNETQLTLRYRVETGVAIAGRPAYLPPDPKVLGDSGLIIAVSRDGLVHAILEKTGEYSWRFSTGEAVAESPAVIDDHIYVSMQLGGMYCLEAKAGKELWFAPRVVQFVAASKTRVYAADSLGRLITLDAKSGAQLDTVAAEGMPIKLANTDTDRIYLADETGLIQCLREVEQKEPIVHGMDRKQVDEPEKKPAVVPKEVEKKPKKEPTTPKASSTPKERPAAKPKAPPKERPAPKVRTKRGASKKGAADNPGDAAAGQDNNNNNNNNPFNQPPANSGKNKKAKDATQN